MTTKTKLSSKNLQVQASFVTLNLEQLVNTGFIHALLHEKIQDPNQVKQKK